MKNNPTTIRLEKKHLDILRKISYDQSIQNNQYISIAELIRIAIEEKYINPRNNGGLSIAGQ